MLAHCRRGMSYVVLPWEMPHCSAMERKIASNKTTLKKFLLNSFQPDGAASRALLSAAGCASILTSAHLAKDQNLEAFKIKIITSAAAWLHRGVTR